MKKIVFLIPAILSVTLLKAQNVGIGTTEPLNKLQIAGNLLVNTPTTHTNSAPTAAQEKSFVNASTITFPSGDSTGRIFDPGGPSGNYLSNLAGGVNTNSSPNAVGIEITAETMDLGTGDSLIIRLSAGSPIVLLAVGNGYTTTGKWVFNEMDLYLQFKSNGDGNNGAGFSLLFRRLYNNSNALPNISGITGNALLFDTKNGAFASGSINYTVRGDHSVAMGVNAAASGLVSAAFGYYTQATGTASTATGYFSSANGYTSTAMGSGSQALGNYSTAIGNGTSAEGANAVAIGKSTLAIGANSTAMGEGTKAEGNFSTAMGDGTTASGAGSTTMGVSTVSRGYAGTAIGMFNNPVLLFPQSSVTASTPLFIVGNGDNSSSLSNAMIVRKDGNVGIGTDVPAANLHIKHAAGGGLILENANDNTKWRIYSASGDNNLTFYNNAGTEIADIDDVTGTFNALSDARYKKGIANIPDVLSLLLQLKPKYYQFNWQKDDEQKQIGFLAQDAYKLFPELVSYSKEKDLYKINYAGFSTIAVKAIQEQQVVITVLEKQMKELSKRNDELTARLERLETLIK